MAAAQAFVLMLRKSRETVINSLWCWAGLHEGGDESRWWLRSVGGRIISAGVLKAESGGGGSRDQHVKRHRNGRVPVCSGASMVSH